MSFNDIFSGLFAFAIATAFSRLGKGQPLGSSWVPNL